MDPKMKEAVDSFLAATGTLPSVTNDAPSAGDDATNENGDGEKKEQKPRIYCEVCDIHCVGEVAFQSHLNGAKHAKVIKNKQLMGKNTVVANNPAECVLTARLKGVKDPVIGLQHLVEFQPANDTPTFTSVWYFCNLCNCKLDPSTVMTHLVGIKHRLAYMRKNYADMVPEIMQQSNRGEQTRVSVERAKTIENREGRRLPSVQTDRDSKMHQLMGEKLENDKQAAKKKRLDKIKKDSIPSKKRAILQDNVHNISGPIIGLEHVIEFQPMSGVDDPSSLHYYCELCDCTCDPSTIRTHIVGMKHRRNYINESCPEMSAELNKTPEENNKAAIRTMLEEYAQTIDSKGRRNIRVNLEKGTVQTSGPMGKKRPAEEPFKGPGKKKAMSLVGHRPMGMTSLAQRRGPSLPSLGGASAIGHLAASPSPRLPTRRPMGLAVSMDRLLQLLDATHISTEEEAELALELSNQLTQSLLEFRKKSVPVHMFEKATRSSGLDNLMAKRPFQKRNQEFSFQGPRRHSGGDDFQNNATAEYSQYDQESAYNSYEAPQEYYEDTYTHQTDNHQWYSDPPATQFYDSGSGGW